MLLCITIICNFLSIYFKLVDFSIKKIESECNFKTVLITSYMVWFSSKDTVLSPL